MTHPTSQSPSKQDGVRHCLFVFEYSKTTHVDTVVEQQEGGAQGEQATTTNCQATTSGMGQSARFYAELTWVIHRNEVVPTGAIFG